LSAGRVAMALNVCVDRALTSWILSFGPFARVTSPAALARDIAHQLGAALSQYAQAGENGAADKAAGP
jgi:predicted DNA-binding transcriptional regulator YafY